MKADEDSKNEVDPDDAVALFGLPPTTVAPTTLVSRADPSKNTTVCGPAGVTRDTDAVLIDDEKSSDLVIVEGEARSPGAEEESCASIGCAARRSDIRDIMEGGIVRIQNE